jgi:hypothetical protein
MTRQFNIFDPITNDYAVQLIDSKETYDYLRNIHYAHRIPSISYAYGLFKDEEIVGVITYGTPASSTLCKGICGIDWQKYVLELNRLVLKNNLPNEASRLVAASLRLLPKPRIIVSFADTAQNHIGIVYQATNFIYTGLSAKRTDWKIKGQEHLHGVTIADKMRNKEGRRVDAMREAYGDDFYLAPRSRKHRYIIFIGNRKEKQAMRSALKYEFLPYPTRTE